MVDHYTHNLISINCTKSKNVDERKVTLELLNSTSEIKVVFAETLHSLELFEGYLKRPSDETTVPLKQFFDTGKCCSAEPLTSDEIDCFLETSRSILITHSLNDKENDEPQDRDQDGGNSGNTLDLNSLPNSISPPLSPHYESRKTGFEDRNLVEKEKPNNVAQFYGHNNPEKAFKIGEDDLAQASSESKMKTKFSEKSSDGQQRNEHKNKEPKSKVISDTAKKGGIKKEKQRRVIHGSLGYSGDENKNKKQNTLKAENSPHFLNPPPALMTRSRVNELEDENVFLRKQVKSLQVKIEEILVELGEISVEKTAKENEERKSEHFHRLFHPPLHEDKRSGTFKPKNVRSKNDQQSSDSNRSSSPPVANTSSDPPTLNTSAVSAASSSEQNVNGAEALVHENDHQLDDDEKLTSVENECELHGRNHESPLTVMVYGDQQTATTHNTPGIQSEEQSSRSEGINQFQENYIQASTSHNGYDDLSFSVQQHDPGTGPISLSSIPPTSVATTLYNNYKILLLSLARNLLSSEVVMLQDWAAQNFSINNPRNATDILFQLDQKGVINASDLHQLSDFFESIIRFDLVHIIDAFLLGDYNLLRQSQTSKNHTENRVQNRRHRAILPNPGILSAMSIRQSSMNTTRNLGMPRKPTSNIGVPKSLPQTQLQSLRNFSDTANSTHLVSPARNQSTSLTQSDPNKPAIGFNSVRMAELAVADGQVAGKCTCSLCNLRK